VPDRTSRPRPRSGITRSIPGPVSATEPGFFFDDRTPPDPRENGQNLGGNSLFRTADRIATEKRHLKRKWKAHITFEDYKSQDRVSIHAPRRQSLSLH
jgi:hypothetical protein